MSKARSGSASAPTVRLIILGKRLQHLREKAGLSYEQAAKSLRLGHLTVRRMEKGEVGLKPVYVEKLLQTYGIAEQSEIDAFLELVVEANQPGWWHRYRDVLPGWFSAYVSLESEASLIRAYEPNHIPGLLQTEDYARAILRIGFPHEPQEEIERRVALRMERQELLKRPEAPAYWGVLDETVLRRPIGEPHVMRDQITHLIEAVSTMSNVTLQVMPFSVGAHPAMYGPFHIFRFRHQELPDVVYSENLIGALYLDERDDVVTFLEAMDRLGAQAIPAPSTLAILDGIRKEI